MTIFDVIRWPINSMSDTVLIDSLPDDLFKAWLLTLVEDYEVDEMHHASSRIQKIQWFRYAMADSITGLSYNQREAFNQIYDAWAIQNIKRLIIDYEQEVLPDSDCGR